MGVIADGGSRQLGDIFQNPGEGNIGHFERDRFLFEFAVWILNHEIGCEFLISVFIVFGIWLVFLTEKGILQPFSTLAGFR